MSEYLGKLRVLLLLLLSWVVEVMLIVTFYNFRLHFKLPICYRIYIKSIKNSVDGELIFVNICRHCKNLKIGLLL